MDDEGRLLGINVRIFGAFLIDGGHYIRMPLVRQLTEAQRPDLTWLRRIFAQAFAASRGFAQRR